MKDSPAKHFDTLGLEAGATPEDIKRAYLALVKRWHPDRFVNDPAQLKIAEEKMRAINVAYEALAGEAKVTESFRRGPVPDYDSAGSTVGRAA